MATVTFAERAWAVEEFHRGLKPFTGAERRQVRFGTAEPHRAGDPDVRPAGVDRAGRREVTHPVRVDDAAAPVPDRPDGPATRYREAALSPHDVHHQPQPASAVAVRNPDTTGGDSGRLKHKVGIVDDRYRPPGVAL